MAGGCIFCSIVDEPSRTESVLDDPVAVAFLDHRPLFPGHVLVVPRTHYPTLGDLPQELVGPFFARVQAMARAVESATGASGTFVAMNNRISQSVPHLHVHVVPRRPKDGLKGFFWPRTKYRSAEEMADVADRIRAAVPEF